VQNPKVSSSPNGFPKLSTIDNLSPSGSVAKPISALFLITVLESSVIFSGVGSGDLPKSSLYLEFIFITLQFNFSNNFGKAIEVAPLAQSITTQNFFSRIKRFLYI